MTHRKAATPLGIVLSLVLGVTASGQAPAGTPGDPETIDGIPRTPEDLALIAAMRAKNINVSSSDLPLPELIQYLRKNTGFNIVIDHEVPEDIKITFRVDNHPFDQAFDLILRMWELAYEVRDGAIVVMPQEKARAQTWLVDYPVGDLVGSGGDISETPWPSKLPLGTTVPPPPPPSSFGCGDVFPMSFVTSTIAPGTWDTAPHTIEFLSGHLIVRHTIETHREIRALLEQVRTAPPRPRIELQVARCPADEVARLFGPDGPPFRLTDGQRESIREWIRSGIATSWSEVTRERHSGWILQARYGKASYVRGYEAGGSPDSPTLAPVRAEAPDGSWIDCSTGALSTGDQVVSLFGHFAHSGDGIPTFDARLPGAGPVEQPKIRHATFATRFRAPIGVSLCAGSFPAPGGEAGARSQVLLAFVRLDPAASTSTPSRAAESRDEAYDREVRAMVNSKLDGLDMEMDFADATLAEMIDSVRDFTCLAIMFQPEIFMSKIAEERRAFTVKGLKLRQSLHLLLAQYGLDWTFYGSNSTIMIVSGDHSFDPVSTRCTNVDGLTLAIRDEEHSATMETSLQGGATWAGASWEQIIQLLQQNVAPNSWTERSSEVSLNLLPDGRLLVRQTDHAHDEIAAFLKTQEISRQSTVEVSSWILTPRGVDDVPLEKAVPRAGWASLRPAQVAAILDLTLKGGPIEIVESARVVALTDTRSELCRWEARPLVTGLSAAPKAGAGARSMEVTDHVAGTDLMIEPSVLSGGKEIHMEISLFSREQGEPRLVVVTDQPNGPRIQCPVESTTRAFFEFSAPDGGGGLAELPYAGAGPRRFLLVRARIFQP